MSDFGGDIDDELLELAGASEKRRRKSESSSSKKRRKTEPVSDSDNDASGSDDTGGDTLDKNPYPLEGRYIDEEDRERLMMMTELDREVILAQRLEERQRIVDKQNLEQLLRAQNAQSGDPEGVSKAAKRQHTSRGATKEKSRKLDELKAKRKAKDSKEQRRARLDSPRRDRSASPMDMETSDDDEEDGQISRFEQEEERDRRLQEDEFPTLEDFEKCRLSRENLVRYCLTGRFEEMARGAWVRFLIGANSGQSIYRMCEITAIVPGEPYMVDGSTVDQSLELRHGKAVKLWKMDRVSNSRFTAEEFADWKRHCEADQTKLPSKKSVTVKQATIARLQAQPLTEIELSDMLQRKSLIQPTKPTSTTITMERSRLLQARTLAERRQEYAEVERIDEELAKLPSVSNEDREPSASDILAQVNERNRKANLESIRRAELAESERKRRERKQGGPKSLLRTNGSAPPSRPITPSVSVKTGDGNDISLEKSLAESVEVDLGEF